MPEKISASIVETFPDAIHAEVSPKTFSSVLSAVKQFLESNNIDPNSVLFAGYRPDISEKSADTPEYYFGDYESLLPGQSRTDDPETAEEFDAVNPILYALAAGTQADGKPAEGRLGIYSHDLFPPNTLVEHDSEAGTYVYSGLSPDLLEQAKIAELHLRSTTQQ